jgi:putative transposase
VKPIRKLLKKQGFVPDVLVTDKLRSYGAARARIAEEQSSREFTSTDTTARAEDAHFKSPGSAQRFQSIHAAVFNLQRPTSSHILRHAPPP